MRSFFEESGHGWPVCREAARVLSAVVERAAPSLAGF